MTWIQEYTARPAYAQAMMILAGLNRLLRLLTWRSAQTAGPGLLRSVRCARRCRIKSEGIASGFLKPILFCIWQTTGYRITDT